jgi:hypothetical protein
VCVCVRVRARACVRSLARAYKKSVTEVMSLEVVLGYYIHDGYCDRDNCGGIGSITELTSWS